MHQVLLRHGSLMATLAISCLVAGCIRAGSPTPTPVVHDTVYVPAIRPRDGLGQTAVLLADSAGIAEVIPDSSFVRIEPGTFAMGDVRGDRRQFDSTANVHGFLPNARHIVTLTRAFYLEKTDVTQRQWTLLMGRNPSSFKGCPNCPVDNVSWTEAQGFVELLNVRTHRGYRLPTEAEWEYAARAGTSGDYGVAGDVEQFAWINANSGGRTHPVAQLKSNPWGLFDMEGNVYQWVSDWYAPFSSDAVTDPVGPETGPGHVLRGGSANNSALHARAAFREEAAADQRSGFRGFRLARDR
jgi:formylglycine-generating enzyme required for sulfatase activity